MTAFPALGLDPCPGEPAVVEEIAGTLRRSGDAMARAADVLRAQDHAWRGEAAAAFHDRVGVRAPGQLVRAEQSFVAAATALSLWADLLLDHQGQAHVLEARAADLIRRVEELGDRAGGLAAEASVMDGYVRLLGPAQPQSVWTPADPRLERAEQVLRELAVARAQLSEARTELAHLRAEAERLLAATVLAADGTARALLTAKAMAPDGPGLLSQAAGAVGGAVSATWDWYVEPFQQLAADTLEFLEEHQEVLRTISEISGKLSTGMTFLALVPFFAPLALPAVALGGLSALTAYGATVGEKGDWSEGFTPGVALGTATAVVGLGALGTAAKLAKASRGGDMMQTGKTIVGSRTVPVGIIGVMRSSGGMQQAETGMRVLDFTVKSGANGLTFVGAVKPARDARRHPARGTAHGRSSVPSR